MTINYEKRALKIGLFINLLCAIFGILFFFITNSISIFLDAFISLILCASTIVSMRVSNASLAEPSEKYPLGRYAIENIFLLFRSIMLITTILISFFSGVSNIVDFLFKKEMVFTQFNNIYLIVYAIIMSGLCFLITIIYRYYNKKLDNKSGIIRIEIMASLFDGIVTIVAISSLLAFNNINILAPISQIGDSLTVLILSIIYIFTPIKELIYQINILTDRRMRDQDEKDLKKDLSKAFEQLNFFDIYLCDPGNQINIYITFLPKNKNNMIHLNEYLKNLSSYLYEKYGENAQVYLHCTKKPLHML